jgi:uncharacterized membrane protein (UPF0127 family)
MPLSPISRTGLFLVTLLVCASCIAQEPYVRLKGEKFTVEVADTPDKQQLGLMFRESMPRDHGMLFTFSGETMRAFWMKNTKIPLDIIYFDRELQLVSVASARPCRTAACKSYPSAGPAMYVLELNAGLADELGLEPGDRLEVYLPGQ